MDNGYHAAADMQVYELEAAVGPNRRKGAPLQWIARLTGLTMVVSAVITGYFGPDDDNTQSVLGLTPRTRGIVYCILQGIWGVTFILYALYGRWSTLAPFQRQCHRLSSILVASIPFLLGLDTTSKIPSSFHPFCVTVLVEAMYLCIEVTCRILLDLVGVLKQVCKGAVIVWNSARRRFNFAIRVGRPDHDSV